MSKKKRVSAKKPAELHQLALDIIHGRVFTDRHLSDMNLIPNVFMPIGLGGLSGVDTKSIGMIYAEMGMAIKMAINGNPIFRSCALLNRRDAIVVWKLVSAMNKALKELRLPEKKRRIVRRRRRG